METITTQQFLNFLLLFLIVSFFTLAIVDFVGRLLGLWQQCLRSARIQNSVASVTSAPEPQSISGHIKSQSLGAEEVCHDGDSCTIASLNATELRKRCTKANIQWRNAHGPGKHLRKSEMLHRLTA